MNYGEKLIMVIGLYQWEIYVEPLLQAMTLSYNLHGQAVPWLFVAGLPSIKGWVSAVSIPYRSNTCKTIDATKQPYRFNVDRHIKSIL